MQTSSKPTRIKPLATLEGLAARGLVLSPYYPRAWGTYRTTMTLKCNILGYGINSTGINVQLIASDASINALVQIPTTVAYSDTDATVRAAVQSEITSYCTGTFGIQAPDIFDWYITTPADLAAAITASALPMYVSGTAKSNYYAVVGAPTVAGGAGVARFYIDSNGDGTGTAPSAVFAASLQAVVITSTTAYVPTAVTVDTNRKYIDVTMKSLTFSTGLAGLLNVLTGQSLTAAANGTTVNCFVLVQK